MKLIVFDIDGTLTNTAYIDEYCFRKIFEDLYDHYINASEWEMLKNRSGWTDTAVTRIILEEILKLDFSKEINKIKKSFIELLKNEILKSPDFGVEIPGAFSMLKLIEKSDEFKFALATGSWAESGSFKLDNIGIKAENYPYSNSDISETRTGIIENAIQFSKKQYQCNFDSIFYIGDGQWDYESAKKLNLKFIGVDYWERNTFKKWEVENVIKSYSDSAHFMNLVGFNNNVIQQTLF